MDIIWYWVGFFVREVWSASNILDLMVRTSRLLQAFESSILARRNVEIIHVVYFAIIYVTSIVVFTTMYYEFPFFPFLFLW